LLCRPHRINEPPAAVEEDTSANSWMVFSLNGRVALRRRHSLGWTVYLHVKYVRGPVLGGSEKIVEKKDSAKHVAIPSFQ